MLLDETSFFLASDFDKQNWQEDILAVQETCNKLGTPFAVERSRSGNGAHLWFFFETAVPAILARKLGAYILTVTMDRRPDIGLDSYDRFFPNQDTLPIPFNQRGTMEVDFLYSEARLVIELDGLQHLDDTEAYRRDRHKDSLLQEHGYFVLRFLTEDVGKDLDAILDRTLRIMIHRTREKDLSK